MAADSGHPAYASQNAVGNLRNGVKVNGVLVAVTTSGVRIFKPTSGKGAHRTWDNFDCRSAYVSTCQDRGQALVVLGSDGVIRAFTLPGLREIASKRLDVKLDPQRMHETTITATGDVLAWTGPAEVALVNVWGTGLVM
jgi:syntaxin-binding protein 5